MTALVVLRAKSRKERIRETLHDAAREAGAAAQCAAVHGKRLSKNPTVMGAAGIVAAGCMTVAAPVTVAALVVGWHAAKAGCVLGEKIAKRD